MIYVYVSIVKQNSNMKTKSYLHCIVTRFDGSTFENHLMLSEAHILCKLCAEHEKVEVSRHKVSLSFYQSIFGK